MNRSIRILSSAVIRRGFQSLQSPACQVVETADCRVSPVRLLTPVVTRAFSTAVDANREAVEREGIAESTNRETSLVIFDKDGTLICFHKMWTPWALSTAKRIESATSSIDDIQNKVFELLGFCPKEMKCVPGLLAEATMPTVRVELAKLLVRHGVKQEEADKIIKKVWEDQDCDTSDPNNLKALHDLKELFDTLKANDVKIAVCTADYREGTERALKKLGIWDYLDHVTCSDDMGSEPKPKADNALRICELIGVPPERTVMVGDTVADLGMAKNADLQAGIAVLSGVAPRKDLEPMADYVVDHVGDILPHVLPKDEKLWRSPPGTRAVHTDARSRSSMDDQKRT